MQPKLFYHHYRYWENFQSFFPERMRINKDNHPIEEYWHYNGHAIHLDKYDKTASNKAVKIIVLHGGGGNGRVLSPIGIALQSHGYKCIIPDLPGFGLSIPSNKSILYNWWIEIVHQLVEKEYEKDHLPIILTGISLGGMLAYQVACHTKNVIGVIATTLADTRQLHVQQQLSRFDFQTKFGNYIFNKKITLFDDFKVPLKAFSKMHSVSNHKELTNKMLNDTRGSGAWVPISFFRSLFTTHPLIEPEKFNNCPILLIHPEKDRMIPLEFSMPFYNKLATIKELVLLENAGHIPIEQPGIDQLENEALKFISKIELQYIPDF